MTNDKYKNALAHARQAYGSGAYDDATLEAIFPELRESEDERNERLEKLIIESVFCRYGNTQEYLDIIAYLEKQKEPHYTKRNALFDECVKNCDPKVMKEVSDRVDEMLGKPSCWDSPVMTHEMIMDEQKEQKPVEPSDDELQRYQDGLHDFKVFAAKQAREHHISFVHDFEWNNFCGEILSYFNEKQKSVWSKEDEMYLSQAIETLEHENYSILADKLKSLKPQPQQEWSEEDKIHLNNAILAAEKEWGAGSYTAKFLKSLRPQWYPSEE